MTCVSDYKGKELARIRKRYKMARERYLRELYAVELEAYIQGDRALKYATSMEIQKVLRYEK